MAKRPSMSNSWNATSDGQWPTVFLVDEDAQDLERYSKMLRVLGYEVRSINSYQQSIDSLGREHFDLVIVEQGSAEFEGKAVLRRAVEVDRHVPVLVFTRNVDVDCCLEALDSGACEYVQKPLSTTELEDLVSDYLGVPGGSDGNRLGMATRLWAA